MIFDRIDGDFFASIAKNNAYYYKTDNVNDAFKNNKLNNNLNILITHNSDYPITEELYQKFKCCGKYKKWFAQNIACKHDDLICLPIGLECKRWCKFDKFEIMKKCINEYDESNENILYANFSINTQEQQRFECINSFVGKTYLTNYVQHSTPNVFVLTENQYKKYCNDILKHKFVLCPEGHGIDTHRFWETLYLGRIPVVLHNYVNDSFSDLPILILDKWSDFEKHINDNIIGTYDKLTQSYWIKKINYE